MEFSADGDKNDEVESSLMCPVDIATTGFAPTRERGMTASGRVAPPQQSELGCKSSTNMRARREGVSRERLESLSDHSAVGRAIRPIAGFSNRLEKQPTAY
jgi:hypothetical protein